MNFEFATAARVVFGRGRRGELFNALPRSDARGLLVTGSTPSRAAWLLEKFPDRFDVFHVSGEPTVLHAEEGARIARESRAEFVVGVGGGGAIDAAKAIAALATNPESVFNHLEVIGAGQPLLNAPLPWFALPTTAGTGAEVTRNAVLLSPGHKVKASLRSVKLSATLAIVDPELTDDLPPSLTASTGMDALTQLIEPFLSSRANPLTDALCRQALPAAAAALPRAYKNGTDRDARDGMALASLFSGMALANAGLGAVHGFAAPIGGMFRAPHGAVCAALLPHVLRVNHAALSRRAPRAPSLDRFRELAALLLGKPGATADDAIRWVSGLSRELAIPPLRQYGLCRDHLPELCARAAQASSMKANPIQLEPAELAEILESAI